MLKKELCTSNPMGGNLHFISAETKEHVNLFTEFSNDTSDYPSYQNFLVEINGQPTGQIYYDLTVNDGDEVNNSK